MYQVLELTRYAQFIEALSLRLEHNDVPKCDRGSNPTKPANIICCAAHRGFKQKSQKVIEGSRNSKRNFKKDFEK